MNSKIYDLIIIPAMNPENLQDVLAESGQLVQWLKQQHQQNAAIASICMGAFIFASTGILDGHSATTHWMGADYFRQMFPQVRLEDDKIIIDEGDIYTCGGAFSFTSLMMYLIEKFCGRQVALLASKVFLIDLYRDPQASYRIFDLQKNHSDEPVSKAQQLVEERFAEKLTIEEMASTSCLTKRTFIRRFKKATGNTPLEYVQRVRIEAAKKALESTDLTVEQISLDSGYDDYGTFRKIFKRYTGTSPLAYRKKYSRMTLELAV